MVNKSTQQRIQVYARCRPLNSSEKKQNGFSIVNTKCEKNEIVVKEKPIDKFSKTFTFDKVFGPNSAQVDVYRNVVMPLIEEVLMGYNCTVFAYGQTGTGKTYTMEGEKSDSNLSWEDDPHAGIIPRTLNQIFEQLKKQNIEFTIRVSFLELYNEELFDLLAPANDTSKLRLYEDSSRKGSVVIQGLEEITVHNKDEVYSILERGALKRQTASTLMNANSSRSHSVFTVTVHIKENTDDGEELVKTGKLNLVDLAGSENIGRSGAIDKRAREAGNINQSLLTLGRVITSLVERAPHIPYRESKLTRLLQDSLGGKTKTSIIATVSPASMNLEETLSTLDYAHRAKNITNKPEINQKLTKRALIKQYTEEIERLRKDLFASREKNGFFIDEENYKELLGTIESQSEEMKTQIDQIEKLEAEVTKIQKLFEETSVHLSEEKGIREKTEMELSETQRNLHETKDVLKVTITDRDEQRYIVGHHVKTEEVLTSQAKQLKSVTKQTTNEIGLLHEKIDRTTSVDAHNSKVKKNFRSHYQEQLLNMEDSVNLFQKGFNQFCDAHHSDLQLKSQALGSQFLSIKAFLADSKHQQDQLLTDLNLVKSKKRDEMLNCVSEHVETTNDFKHQSVEKVERFLNEDWDMCYKSMAGLLFQQSNIFNEMHERFSQYINSTQGYVENYVTNTRSNLSCLKTSFDQLLKHHDKSQNDVNDELKKLSDHQEIMAAKIQEDIMSNLKSALSGCFVNFKKQTDGHFEQVNESMKMCRTNIHSEQEQINSVIGKEQSSANEWLDSLSKDASTVLEDIGKYHKEVESASSDFSQGLKTFDEVASQFSSETITLNNNMCDKTKECFDKMCLRENCFAEREAALSQDLNNKVDELKNHVEDGLNSAENDDQEKNIEYLEELKAHKEFSEKWKNEMIHALHLRDQDIDRLLNEELEVNIVTGQTPKRREYCYPNSLAATSPHDRILKRFRQRTNVNLGAVVPLPMESSDEADQNISTDKESDVFSSSILSGRGYSSDSDNSKENSFTVPSKLPRSKLHSSLNSLNDSKQKRNAHRQPLGPRQEV